MVVFCRGSHSWQRVTWLALIRTLVLMLMGFLPIVAGFAQADPPPPYRFQLENGGFSGLGNSYIISRVPILTASGGVSYVDLSVKMDFDQDGNASITTATVVSSANLIMGTFKPGKYVGPKNMSAGKGFVTVNGPGVQVNGTTTWSAGSTSDSADSCGIINGATWYTGSIDNSPVASRLKNARGADGVKTPITSPAWSYGVAGTGPTTSCPGNDSFVWPTGALIGVSQTGNSITFASFSDRNSYSNYDFSSPVAQVTYTLIP